MNKLVFTIFLAAVLWTVMFSPWTAPFVNFWWMMTGSALTLSIFATLFSRGWWRDVKWSLSNILLGFGVAIALWCVFWIGDKVSTWIFDFARPQVNLIYGMKEGESPWLLTALMLFLIGPAEEIFWRGYVQRTLSERWNPNKGFMVATTLYALVHAVLVTLCWLWRHWWPVWYGEHFTAFSQIALLPSYFRILYGM